MEGSAFKLIDNISDVYAHLLPDFFSQSFPNEILATCDQCILLEDNNTLAPYDVQGTIMEYCIFHPDVKCCTYEPDLPNFLAGAILSSTENGVTEGQQRILHKIEQGEGITPQGIMATKNSSQEYHQLVDQSSECLGDIGCPYFDKSKTNCSIWLFRQANCSTFFCKSVEGIAGQEFWGAMNYYLTGVEKELSRFAAQSIEHSADLDLWRRDKVNFYQTAYHTITNLNSDDLQKICNANLAVFLDQVKKSYIDATTTSAPMKLRKNPSLKHEQLSNATYRYDTGQGRCIISERLHPLLHYFDGNNDNEKVVELIAEDHQIHIPSSMLLRLYKNRILIPASGAES